MLTRRPMLGVGLRDGGAGATVTRVLAGACAADLREGDAIVAIDGGAVRTVADVGARLRAVSSDRYVVSVRRGARDFDRVVDVVPMPHEIVEGAEVRYGHAVWRGHRLRTIATVPDRADPQTVALLPGIQCQSVDLALAPDAPLARLVRAWSGLGLATLRVERPGLGDSEGPPCASLDLEAEVSLHEAAIGSIGPERLVLFGHSLGAMVAALLWNRASAVVAYGGTAHRWSATLRDGLERQLALRGASPAAIAARLARFDADPFSDTHGRSIELHRQLDVLDDPWSRVGVPVLVLVAEHDWVTGREAQLAIAARAPLSRVVELDGLDHAFTRHASLAASLREHGRGTFDARIAEEVARFAHG